MPARRGLRYLRGMTFGRRACARARVRVSGGNFRNVTQQRDRFALVWFRACPTRALALLSSSGHVCGFYPLRSRAALSLAPRRHDPVRPLLPLVSRNVRALQSLSSSELNVCHQPAVENEAEQHSSPPSSVPRAVHQRQTPVTWRSSSSLRSSPSSSQLAGAQRQVSHPQPRSPFAHQGCLGQPVMVSGAGMGSCALRPSDATDKANHAPMRGAHPNSNAYHSLPPLTADQLASDSLLSLAGMPPPSSPLPVASSSGASASVEEEDEEDGGCATYQEKNRRAAVPDADRYMAIELDALARVSGFVRRCTPQRSCCRPTLQARRDAFR